MKKMQMTYGYDDVTLVPAYSNLSSRKESSTKFDIYDLPIIASCMDTLGYDLMRCVTTNNIPFVAHRAFKSAEEQFNYFIPNNEFKAPFHVYQNIWWAVGSVQKYEEWITYLYDKGVRKFCIDMAHGDSKACIDTIKFIKNLDILKKEDASRDPEKTLTSFGNHDIPIHIIAGNVATPEGFKRLEKAGADGIRIGIASGQICFTGDTLVTVWKGHGNNFYQKQIKHIKIGDIVVTSTGRVREVLKIYENDYFGEIYKINDDIKVTPTHKFHVFDHIKHEKTWIGIKDFNEKRYSFLDYSNKTHKANLDIDEYNGKVYNLEVDDEHTYTVGKLMFGVKNCSTAINTGFGVPILTNIIESVKARKNKNTWIIADGGVKNVGDIAKAIYFGADFCMIGKLFASTNLACGRSYDKNFNIISNDDLNNIVYKEYHGMASRDARKNILTYASVEGVAGMVKYTGTTEDFLNDTKLRLQASLSYAGAKNWEEFRKNTYPVMRSNAGIIAGDTHLDVTIDK